jgi:hypothetical protein
VTTPVAVEPAPPEPCSACGGALDTLGRCAKCGAVFGEAYRCPLCQALSDVEESPVLYYRCRTCGGPRVPPSAGAPSDRETALLKTARAEQLRALAFRAGSGFVFASGLLSLLVTNVVLLATSPAPLAKAFALFASAVPLVLAFLAFRRSKMHQKRLEQALQQAWLLAAGRVAAEAGGAASAQSLAKTLRIDEARAELLLAELSVQDFVDPHALPAAKVRVTELADPSELLATAEPSEARADTSKP